MGDVAEESFAESSTTQTKIFDNDQLSPLNSQIEDDKPMMNEHSGQTSIQINSSSSNSVNSISSFAKKSPAVKTKKFFFAKKEIA